MSPRQVHDLYNHPRDKDGAVKVPRGTSTADVRTRLVRALLYGPRIGMKPELLDQIRQRLKELDGHPA